MSHSTCCVSRFLLFCIRIRLPKPTSPHANNSHCKTTSFPPFRITWQATDTSLSFNALATGSADIAITYLPYAEHVAVRQGVAESVTYAWRDHWALVGPKSNPASLPTDGRASIYELFALIFQAAIATQDDPEPVRFLSRYDKSANNISESAVWTAIGQSPWSHPYSPWYHRFVSLPFAALRTACALNEYTLVDRGSWCCLQSEVSDKMTVFKESFDAAEDDPMLNPAHVLVGSRARDKDLARVFAKWMGDRGNGGGQDVIKGFERNGLLLHAPAPEGVDPLEHRVKKLT